ncbi:MAG TPA: tyrosine-type recombinase/integrase [Solirubrobacterales bacterium]|jgi:integrase|nr:tyrosine-type recombinase/integrase [Solirubrobacterales bacterium]
MPAPIDRKVLSRPEIAQLEGAATSERDKLIVRILADCGVRPGELSGLTTDSIRRRDDGMAFLKVVRGKGDREQFVPILPDLAARIERFIKDRPVDARGDHLFVSLRRGHDGGYAPLSQSSVAQLVRGLADKAGITKRVHPHIFRHSYATELIEVARAAAARMSEDN